MTPTPSQPTWHWELTPAEILHGCLIGKSPAGANPLPQLAFSCPKLAVPAPAPEPAPEVEGESGAEPVSVEPAPVLPPSPFEGITYQLALSRRSAASEARELCQQHPDVPDSGDERSGVLLFAGEQLIGSFEIHKPWTFSLAVDEKYQGKKLGQLMLLLWFQNVKCPTGSIFRNQLLSKDSVKVFQQAHAELLDWAQANGHEVPKRVLSAPAITLPR